MDDEVVEEQSFVRPFMVGGVHDSASPVKPLPQQPANGSGESESDGGSAIRPYMVTGGRVHDSDDAVEKIYQAIGVSNKSLSREHAQVLALCTEPQSVAEISAHLDLPLGVAAVLSRDLLNAGLVASSAEDVDVASDISILMRLKDAIRAL